MIEVTVTTKMQFKNSAELQCYLGSNSEAQITGFSKEIKTAWKTGKPFVFTTPRPDYGCVVLSEITVSDSEAT